MGKDSQKLNTVHKAKMGGVQIQQYRAVPYSCHAADYCTPLCINIRNG